MLLVICIGLGFDAIGAERHRFDFLVKFLPPLVKLHGAPMLLFGAHIFSVVVLSHLRREWSETTSPSASAELEGR